MGAGARALSSPSSHLEASMSPSRPPRCAALRLGAGARLFACLPVRRFDPVSGRHLLLVLSWDGTSPCVSQVAFCSCPFRPRLLSRSHFHFFPHSLARADGRTAHGHRRPRKGCRYGLRLRRPVNRFSLPSSPPTPRISSPIPRSTSKSTRSLSGGVSGVHPSPPTRARNCRPPAERIPQTHNPASPQPAARCPPPARRGP